MSSASAIDRSRHGLVEAALAYAFTFVFVGAALVVTLGLNSFSMKQRGDAMRYDGGGRGVLPRG